MKLIYAILGFLLVSGGVYALSRGTRPATPDTQLAAVAVETATPAPSATPYFTPTADPALVAQATAIALQKAQADADLAAALAAQEQLKAQLLQTEADKAKALADAEVVRAQNKVLAEQSAAELADQLAREQINATLAAAEQARKDQQRRNQFLLIVIGALGLLGVLWVGARAVREGAEARVAMLMSRNQEELIEAERASRSVPAQPVTVVSDQGARIVRPVVPQGILQEHAVRVSRWVVEHGYRWSDEMRRGEGTGMSHALYVQFRTYLVQAGVLELVNNSYRVTPAGMDFFQHTAEQDLEQGRAGSLPLEPAPA